MGRSAASLIRVKRAGAPRFGAAYALITFRRFSFPRRPGRYDDVKKFERTSAKKRERQQVKLPSREHADTVALRPPQRDGVPHQRERSLKRARTGDPCVHFHLPPRSTRAATSSKVWTPRDSMSCFKNFKPARLNPIASLTFEMPGSTFFRKESMIGTKIWLLAAMTSSLTACQHEN